VTINAWASRETSGSLTFFERLLLRVSEIFLTEALVTLGATAGSAGLSAGTGDIEGAVVLILAAPHHLCIKKSKLCITRKKQGKKGAIEELE
jgi:hypothetical protein